MEFISFAASTVAIVSSISIGLRAQSVLRVGRDVESLTRALRTELVIHRDLIDMLASLCHILERGEVINLSDDINDNTSLFEGPLRSQLGFEKARIVLETLHEARDILSDLRKAFNILSFQGQFKLEHVKAVATLIRSFESRSQPTRRIEEIILDSYNNRSAPLSGALQADLFLPLLKDQIGHVKSLHQDVLRLLNSYTWPSQALGPLRMLTDDPTTGLLTHSAVPTIIPTHISNISDSRIFQQRSQQQMLLNNSVQETRQELMVLPPNSSRSLTRRMSWWKILMLSPHRAFFAAQAIIFFAAIGISIAWALWKRDLGTATGLGGIIFAVGSTINTIVDKCYDRRLATSDDEYQLMPLAIDGT